MRADELLRAGQLSESLVKLQEEVRKDPADVKKRIFLFQILCALGQWERAHTQLNVCAEMDSTTALMVQTYAHALRCEMIRREVFSGRISPMIFGEPREWIGLLAQANQLTAQGNFEKGADIRAQALELAPAVGGRADDKPFAWIADMDSRLGPVLEAVMDGKYYWVPLECVSKIFIEEPTDLRDLIWAPAHFTWANGGERFALLPVRYPGSENQEDDSIRLSRKTDWVERPGDTFLGFGQRMLATDSEEYPFLQIRRIELDNPASGQSPPPQE